MIDCLNLCPNDYRVNRDLCSEEYPATDFAEKEIKRKSTFASDYLKLAFYPQLKRAIERNCVEEMKLIHQELIQMGLHLKDFNPNSSLHDCVQGERYIPLLFVAIEHRSYASLQYLLELGIPVIGRMYLLKSEVDTNSYWRLFRSEPEELECFDVIEIIHHCEIDAELKAIFQQQLSVNETTTVEIEQPENASIEQKVSERPKTMKIYFPLQNIKSQMCVLL